jgi:DNA repair protein RadC
MSRTPARRRRAPQRAGPPAQLAHDAPTRTKLRSAADVADYLQHLKSAEQEHLWCLGLDAHHRVVTSNCVALGTVNEVKVVQRDVFRELVRANCLAFIIVHNHPSGESLPSPQDTNLTNSLQKSGAMLGISLLDHVIVAGESYYSYAERGQLTDEKGITYDRRDS